MGGIQDILGSYSMILSSVQGDVDDRCKYTKKVVGLKADRVQL